MELLAYATTLEALGHTITSRWLHGTHGSALPDEALHLPEHRVVAAAYADEDYEDVWAADVLIAFTEAPVGRYLPSLNIPSADEVEQWKPVAGSRLAYTVSSFGRIRNGEGESITGKIHHKGYRRVLPNGKAGKVQAVHQLVAAAFLGPCPDGQEIDHKDTRKNNNWVGNLEYVTHAENIRRSESYGLRNCKGEHNGRAKLTWEDVAEIREATRHGSTRAALARMYEISETVILKIAKGLLWPIEPDNPSRGGMWVELGLALAWRKRVMVIKFMENVFCALPQVEYFPTFEACVQALQETTP